MSFFWMENSVCVLWCVCERESLCAVESGFVADRGNRELCVCVRGREREKKGERLLQRQISIYPKIKASDNNQIFYFGLFPILGGGPKSKSKKFLAEIAPDKKLNFRNELSVGIGVGVGDG